jgi:hypothetical protein
MKILPLKATSKFIYSAFIFIALFSLSTRATCQTVYRCGNSYSQTPCPGAEILSIDGSRDSQQKEQTDEAVRPDARKAKSLEKMRIAQQMAILKQQPTAPKASAPTDKKTSNERNAEGVHKNTPQHNRPDAFVTQVPGSAKKAVKKKTAQKPASAPG